MATNQHSYYGILDDGQLKEYLGVLNPELFNVEHCSDRLYKLMQSCHHATAGTGLESFIFWTASYAQLVAAEDKLRDAWNGIGEHPFDVTYLAKECDIVNNHALTNYLNQNIKSVIDEQIAGIIDGITTQAEAELAIESLAKISGLSPLQLDRALKQITRKSGLTRTALHETYLINRSGESRESTWPHPGKNSRRPLTYENMRYFLGLHRIDVKLNLMTGRLHILTPNRVVSDRIPDDRYDYDFMTGLMAEAGITISKKDVIYRFAHRYANQPGRIYHPVQEWLEQGTCDYRDHFGWLLQSIGCSDMNADIKRIYLSKWLLQCIEGVYEPSGIRSSVMLILQGETGIGKTRWLSNLIPDKFSYEWLESTDVQRYRALLNRKTLGYEELFESWICEVAGIDTLLLKQPAGGQKAGDERMTQRFLDRNIDRRGIHINYRRTSFVGTYNTDIDFARWVANRRYLVMPVTAIDFQVQIDPLQLWLQVKSWYDDGLRHYMSIEDIREHLQYVAKRQSRYRDPRCEIELSG